MSPDEAIRRVYEGLSGLGNSFEKVKNIKELLGKAGLGKSVEDIAKALQGSTREFDRQAEALKQWDAMGDALTATMFNLKVAIAELLAPFTTTKVATVDQFKAALLGIGSAVVVGQIFNLVAAFKALNTALKGTAALSAALGALKGGKGLAMGAAAIAAYTGAMVAFGGDDKDEAGATGGATGAQTPEGEGEGDNGKKGGNQAAQMRERLELLKQQTAFDVRRLELQQQAIGGSQTQQRLAESMLQKDQEQAQALAERNQALAKENLTGEQRGLIEAEYGQKIERANALHKARSDLINLQAMNAGRMAILETDQLEERLRLQKTMMDLEEQRFGTSEAEMQRGRAQMEMEQKLLQLKQDKERLDRENRTEEAQNTREYKERVSQIAMMEKAARDDFASKSKIINEDERIRLALMGNELTFMRERMGLSEKALTLENESRYLSEYEVRRAQEELTLNARLLDIEQQRKALRIGGKANTPEGEKEQERLNALETQARRESEIRRHGIKLDEEEAKTWSAGWEKAMRDFANNANNFGRAGEASFGVLVGSMNAAIDNFVRTGKFAFKDFAASVIRELIAIQMKAQAVFLLNAAFKAFGLPTLPGKAGGGAVSENLPYMVGENGPELFIPQSGGTIVPNGRLGGEGAMSGQTINYNGPYIASMSAIDTQSASQFLAKNRQSVWAANQSASRSMPQSR